MFALLTILIACGPKKLEPNQAAKTQASRIFQKHVDAIGGEQRLLKHKSARIEGKIRRMDRQKEFRFITIKVAPNKLRSTVKTIGSKKTAIQRATDGKAFWIWENDRYRPASDEEKASIKMSADFYAELNMNRQYAIVYDVSDIQFAGRSCHAVLTKNRNGKMVELYFDKELGFKRGFSTWSVGESENRRWVRFGHYVDINGTKVPFSIEDIQGNAHKLTLINSHKWDSKHKPIKVPKKLRTK